MKTPLEVLQEINSLKDVMGAIKQVIEVAPNTYIEINHQLGNRLHGEFYILDPKLKPLFRNSRLKVKNGEIVTHISKLLVSKDYDESSYKTSLMRFLLACYDILYNNRNVIIFECFVAFKYEEQKVITWVKGIKFESPTLVHTRISLLHRHYKHDYKCFTEREMSYIEHDERFDIFKLYNIGAFSF